MVHHPLQIASRGGMSSHRANSFREFSGRKFNLNLIYPFHPPRASLSIDTIPPEIRRLNMPEIKKVSFTHEALILWLLENPHRPLRDCAEYFGYTQAWLSTIIHSDAFQEQLAKRQNEFAILNGIDIRKKLSTATDIALEGLTRKLEECQDPEFLLDATDKLLHRMGYAPASARNPAGQVITNNVQNNITVSSGDLAEARNLLASRNAGREQTIEVDPFQNYLVPALPNASA